MPNQMQKEQTLEQAYRYCQDIANQHYENFPTASLLLKKELRPAVAVIYAFARAADDFADEGDYATDERLALLENWEQQLDLCLEGKSENPVFIALADVMLSNSLPVQLFRDLLIAFRMDVNFQGFENLDELKFYCKHSADPVGRLMLALHNIDDAHALICSDAICTALQLTNFWQDFKVDIPKGRCYLATDWLKLAHVNREDLLIGEVSSEQIRPALNQAIMETENLFSMGFGLLPYLPLRLRLQIAATLAGGRTILKATSKLEHPLYQRPMLSKLDWLMISFKIGLLAMFPNYFAKRGRP